MKFIFRFFAVLGVIFFCLLIGLGYFIVTDPYNLRPLFMSMYENSTQETTEDGATSPRKEVTEEESGGTNPNLSNEQAQALKSIGMDATAVPPQFTPEQITCFVTILGQARVDAIVAGATPTPTEFFQAKDCL